MLTPELDLKNDNAELEGGYFPDHDATYSSAVNVERYTTYSPSSVDWKGPGE